MKVCLVRPPILVPANNPIVQFTSPLGIAFLAGALRHEGVNVSVVDGLGEALDERYPVADDCYIYGLQPEEVISRIPCGTEIIGISAMFSFEWPTCRSLIGQIRERFPSALLVAGGEHITAVPDLSLNESELDVVVLGEGEEALVKLVEVWSLESQDLSAVTGIKYKAADGEIHGTSANGRIRDIDGIPAPAWDLIPIEAYLDRGMGFGVHRGRSMPVLASRGSAGQNL